MRLLPRGEDDDVGGDALPAHQRDAAGVDAVVAADPVTDWGNPNLVRASKGTLFALPVATASTDEAVAWLREHDVALVVTTPETDLLHTDVDLETGRVAWSEATVEDRRVRQRPAQPPAEPVRQPALAHA